MLSYNKSGTTDIKEKETTTSNSKKSALPTQLPFFHRYFTISDKHFIFKISANCIDFLSNFFQVSIGCSIHAGQIN